MNKPKKINDELYVFGTQYKENGEIQLSGQAKVTSDIQYKNIVTLYKLIPIKTFNKEEYIEALKVNFKNITL